MSHECCCVSRRSTSNLRLLPLVSRPRRQGDVTKERDLVTLPRFLDASVVALGTNQAAFTRTLELLTRTYLEVRRQR